MIENRPVLRDGRGDAELIITATFEEHGGKTRLVSHSLCSSKEVRDTIIASGMEHGMRETWTNSTSS